MFAKRLYEYNLLDNILWLWFLIYADVIYFHSNRKGRLIDAFLAAPVATPGKVQDDVEGVVEGPLVVAVAQHGFLKVQLLLAVYVCYYLILSPEQTVYMEVALGLLDGHGVGLVGLVGVVVGLGVDG